MTFVHEDPDFLRVLDIAAETRNISPALIEKDYWVTHTLWALQRQGWEFWFKGGTSLSKGFGLLERFSEDLDLKVEPGIIAGLPAVSSWKSESAKSVEQRRLYFDSMVRLMRVDGAEVVLAQTQDGSWRGANIEVRYPGHHLDDVAGLGGRDFVLLEIGDARVTPHVLRDLDSFVHRQLQITGQAKNFADNRPKAVRCVHPLVTLLEKLDAIHRRFAKPTAAASFVRHYEDAARIIQSTDFPELPEHGNAQALAQDLLAKRQLVALPDEKDQAFQVTDGPRWQELSVAWTAIGPMYWGPRIPLDQAGKSIRAWIQAQL